MCGVRDKLSLTLFPRVKELLSVQVSIGANLPTKMTWVKNIVCCCVAEDKEQCYLLNLFFLFPWVMSKPSVDGALICVFLVG